MELKEKYEFQIDIDQARAFTNAEILEDYSTAGLHYHDYPQLLMINKGVAFYEEEGERVPHFGNTAIYIPQERAHRTLVYKEPIFYRTIYFHPEDAKRLPSESVVFETSALTRELLNSLCYAKVAPLYGSTSRQIYNLLLTLIREDIGKKCVSIHLPKSDNEDILKIVNFIHDHYESRISYQELGSVLPYTLRHSSRLFKKQMNISIMNYLRLYRMFIASVKLRQTDHSVSRVAFDVGYNNLASFYQDFNRMFALAPNAYRSKTSL